MFAAYLVMLWVGIAWVFLADNLALRILGVLIIPAGIFGAAIRIPRVRSAIERYFEKRR